MESLSEIKGTKPDYFTAPRKGKDRILTDLRQICWRRKNPPAAALLHWFALLRRR
jgi:hypothetical protein